MFRTICLLVVCGLTVARHFDNPVLDGANYPDPGVILYEGVYYAVTTSNEDQLKKFPIHISTDLQNWEQIGYIFDSSNLPVWSAVDHPFWAPEIHKLGDEFRVYFTSTDTASSNTLCIGVATSKNITGPYTPLDRPLLVIDGTFTLDSTLINENGSLKLLYVEEYYISERNLTDDGLALKDNITVKLFRPEFDWEGPTTEGPWYLFRNGYHYVFYSGNNFCTDLYALGVARSNVSSSGPYEKYPEPLLVSNDRFKGPGHGSIIRDIDGEGYVFVHHAWKDGFICGDNFRLMFSTSMEWGDDDWPKKMSMT